MSLISPTTFDLEAGRWGGFFWSIVQRMPAYGDRSLFFVLLSPVGSAVVGIIWHELQANNLKKEAMVWISSVIAWSSILVINRQVFHRYFEGQVLIFMLLSVFILGRNNSGKLVAGRRWPIGLLSVAQACMLNISTSE